jgi:O-antigen biosynthesis protein
MHIALIFDRHHEGTTGVYFERACQQLGMATQHFWMRDAATIPEGFDLYLRVDHGDYTHPWPTHLHPAVFYVIDTHLPKSFRKIRRQAAQYDWLLCAQQSATRQLPHSSWLPLACDPERHGGSAVSMQHDVGFVGTEGGVPRKLYLQALRERYPNSYIGHALPEQMSAVYRSSKIAFNYGIDNDINMRVFEAMCAGSCLLTNTIRQNGWETLFTDREHLVEYQSPHELLELLDYYLSHESERKQIAQAGQRLVQEQHTYAHRVRALCATLHERIGLQPIVLEEKVS